MRNHDWRRYLAFAALIVGISLLGVTAAFAAGGPPSTPPGQTQTNGNGNDNGQPGSPGDDCSHGASGQACKPDPNENGKDCDDHGNARGNEDHCLPPTTTTTEMVNVCRNGVIVSVPAPAEGDGTCGTTTTEMVNVCRNGAIVSVPAPAVGDNTCGSTTTSTVEVCRNGKIVSVPAPAVGDNTCGSTTTTTGGCVTDCGGTTTTPTTPTPPTEGGSTPPPITKPELQKELTKQTQQAGTGRTDNVSAAPGQLPHTGFEETMLILLGSGLLLTGLGARRLAA